MSDLLHKIGIKNTANRRILLDILIKKDDYITAEELYALCCDNGNSMDLSTIYRNLELFYKKGLLNKVALEDGTFSYLIIKERHTHKLTCSKCHKEIVIDCPMRQISKAIEDETGFTLSHDISFNGICKDCKKKH